MTLNPHYLSIENENANLYNNSNTHIVCGWQNAILILWSLESTSFMEGWIAKFICQTLNILNGCLMSWIFFLHTRQMENSLSIRQKQQLAKRFEPSIMKKDVFSTWWDMTTDWNNTSQPQKLMKELHEGIVGGHFVIEITPKKILDARY